MTDAAGTTTYTYDDANRLTSVALPGAGVQTYIWDDRGNLIHDGVFTYTYNAAGRMVRAERLTATLQYTYTADGLRIAQDAARYGVEVGGGQDGLDYAGERPEAATRSECRGHPGTALS